MSIHMNVLVELDDKLARELDRVAPARSRQRSEFIRIAIRKALMEEAERRTREAYLARPDSEPEHFAGETWTPTRPRRAKKKKAR